MLFLTRRAPLSRDESGSALVAVIGVFAVMAVVGLTLAAGTINAVSFTSGTRAAVQAQASAEAGIDVAEAGLMRGQCPITAPVPAGTTLVVSHSLQLTGDSWSPGCPPSAAQRVKVVATGSASARGVAGNTAGNTRRVEAIYATPVSASGIAQTGPAIYAHSASDFTGSGRLLPVEGSAPSVQVKTGDVVCNGASVIPYNLVVAGGAVTISASCSVTGDVWASGAATLSGDVAVGGNVTANGLSLTGSSRILGSAWSSGPTTLDSATRITGNLSGTSLKMTGAWIRGNAWLSGAAVTTPESKIDGLLTARSLTGGGTTSGGRNIIAAGPGPGPAPAPMPVVPGWVDFDYQKSDWVGFDERVVSGNCDYTVLQNAATALGSAPGIIDARGCTNAITVSDYQKLALGNDLVIVAKSFRFGGSGGFSASSPRKLWLITEDTVKNGAPTCASGSEFTYGGGFTISTEITTMVYSPCTVRITSGVSWRGQIYGGGATVDGNAEMRYIPVGLPRVDLTTGVDQDNAGAASVSKIGARLLVRDVNG
jgi:cytoskeletal protein CcmA (bactofilin family)